MERKEYLARDLETSDIFLILSASWQGAVPYFEYEWRTYFEAAYRVVEAFKKFDFNHPNLLTVDNCYFSEETEEIFILNRLNNDLTLEQLMKQEGKLSIAQATNITLQILSGLDYAHQEKKMFHGDLRPDNIILNITDDEKYTIKIAHYGIVDYLFKASGDTRGEESSDFQFMLSVHNFGTHEPWVDVYSSAVIFYYMLTKKLPVKPLDMVELSLECIQDIYAAKRNNRPWTMPTPIEYYDESIPQPLAKLINWALRDRNFKNAKAFQNALISVTSNIQK